MVCSCERRREAEEGTHTQGVDVDEQQSKVVCVAVYLLPAPGYLCTALGRA